MAEQSIVVRKRRFFDKRTIWILGGAGVILLIGMIVQVRMTWSRERLRDISSDATDALHAARFGASTLTPSSNPFQPLIDLFSESSDEPTSK